MANDATPELPPGTAADGEFKKASRYWNYAHEDDALWLHVDGEYRRWAAPSPAAVSRVQHAFAYLDRFDVLAYVAGDERIHFVSVVSK